MVKLHLHEQKKQPIFAAIYNFKFNIFSARNYSHALDTFEIDSTQVFIVISGRHNIQHNDTQHNDKKHIGLICDTQRE